MRALLVNLGLPLTLAALVPSFARAADDWQPDPAMVAAARKDGEALVYTPLIVDQIVRPLVRSFESRVSGVRIKYVRGDGTSTLVRMINEAQAGRVQSDVWGLSEGLHALLQRGLAAEFEVPSAQGLPAAFVDPNKHWVAVGLAVRSLAYNTAIIPKAQAPKTYQDLLDPRWKGKMAWNPKSMSGAWGFISTVIKDRGEERGIPYLRALAKQNVVPLAVSIRAVLDRVIAGEYAIGLEMNNTHAAVSAAQGAPVQWVPLDPVTEMVHIAGITKGAPHPNAGRLFLDFMVSRAGQAVFRDNNYVPMHPDVPAKVPELRPEQGGYRAVLYNPETIDADQDRAIKLFNEIFR
jgi:ABC-type Fe3+ transport system substrate-binding protein